MFGRIALAFTAMALALPAHHAVQAQGNCPNCDLPPGCRGNGNQKPGKPPKRNCQTLDIQIESDIDFGRVVMLNSSGGRVILDLSTGEKHVIGELDDLGGMPITGQASITGAPFEPLRIDLPTSVTLRDTTGGGAQVRDFVTDLSPAPRLDANGQLSFRFSGTLVIDASTAATGKLRGRIPISVEYP